MDNTVIDVSTQTRSYSYYIKKFWRTQAFPLALVFFFLAFALLIAVVYHGVGRKAHNVRLDTESAYKKVRNTTLKMASIERYPFVGALYSKRPHTLLCTSVVLNSQYLLVSAHCFTVMFPQLWVRVGSELWDQKGKEYQVNSFISNELFNATTMENNFALVHVKGPILMTQNVKPAKIEVNFSRARRGIILGWNNRAVAERQNMLMEQELIIWKHRRCANYIGSQTNAICASVRTGLCNLEITGPLVVNGALVGLWSSGLSCTEDPLVFSNMHQISSWFKTIIS